MPNDTADPRTRMPRLRRPTATGGADIRALVKICKPLDENSMSANLIQADHFRDTCVVADLDGEVVGWLSGHMIPAKEELFVWQVAIGERARGLGLGEQMLRELVAREACDGATHLKTTIAEDNDTSWGLFRSFVRDIGGDLTDTPHFEREAHFNDRDATEHMVMISLAQAPALARAA